MGLTTFINVVIGVSLGGLLYTIWSGIRQYRYSIG